MRVVRPIAVVVLLFGALQSAQAAFITPGQWTRPTSDAQALADRTTAQEWNVFATPAGPNDPDVAEVNPGTGVGPNLGKANLYDTSGGSFVTSGGNIYSPTAVLTLDADIPSYGLGADHRTTVVFQLRSLGSEANYDTVRLTYADAAGDPHTVSAVARQELDRVQLGGFGGAQVDTLFTFEVPFSPASFKLEFDAAGTSMSVDRVAIDTLTSVLPEPGAALVVASIAATFALRPRRGGR